MAIFIQKLFHTISKISKLNCNLEIYYVWFIAWPLNDTENSQPQWSFHRSKRGATVLMVNGHQFYRYGSGSSIRWLCRCYRQFGYEFQDRSDSSHYFRPILTLFYTFCRCPAKCQESAGDMEFVNLNHTHGVGELKRKKRDT